MMNGKPSVETLYRIVVYAGVVAFVFGVLLQGEPG